MLKDYSQPAMWGRWWRGDFAGAPRWLLVIAVLVTMGSLAFALFSPQSSLRLIDNTTVAIFIGDSYAAGTGASSPERRWTTLVSETEGWQEHNFAFGGTGYVTTAGKAGCGKSFCPAYLEALNQALAATPKPGVIVVSGGRNDLGSNGRDAAVARFFDEVCLDKGGAQVIVVAPLWQSDQAPASLTTLSREVEEQSSRCGIRFIDLGSPLDGTESTVANDGIHPNDGGHEAIAEAFEKLIQAR